MIIHQQKASLAVRKISKKNLYFIGGLVSLLALVYLFSSLPYDRIFSSGNEHKVILIDAEKVRGKEFVIGKERFGNGATQNSEYAFSGTYSSKVNAKNKFGFGYTLRKVKPGDRYRITVWRYRVNTRLGYLVASTADADRFYKKADDATLIRDDGWEQMELNFMMPYSDPGGEDIKIYVFGDGSGEVYFDDLKIEKLPPVDPELVKEFPEIDLQTDNKSMRKLEDKRTKAQQVGILITEDDDWVKGRINEGEKRTPVSFRLKGDWLDHLQGRKWSFRIKAKDPHAWQRMITFSVQTPHARHFLDEWVFHKFLEKEDVLTTRYDFITLKLNGDPLGVYAYEEHFEKQVAEHKNRREGPIIRMTEEGAWGARRRDLEFRLKVPIKPTEGNLNAFESSDIRPFKEGKTQGSEVLAKQFEIAHNLMYQYKFGLKDPSEVFDLDLLAKYYAIVDITEAYHSIVWHNQRFYYNPITSKLEPIGFDGFTNDGPMRWVKKPFIGYKLNKKWGYIYADILYGLFMEEEFAEKYMYYVHKFSSGKYIDNFLFELDEAIDSRQALLQQEWPDYVYDKEAIRQNALKIRMLLYPFDDAGVRAYTQESSATEKSLKAGNYHIVPVQVMGFGKNADEMRDTLADPLFLNAYNPNFPAELKELKAPVKSNYVFFRVAGIDSMFYSNISPWKAPEDHAPAQELFADLKLETCDMYSVKGETVIFNPGDHEVVENLLIPEGFVVRFPAGTSLDLQRGSAFISKSPVFMYGTEEAPIRIYSSDKSGNGFTVLKAEDKSVLHYVVFDQLNTLNYKGWMLTGAVNFFESDVEIDRCSFVNNLCEDALNTIRCEFEVKNSLIGNTFADGFDSDFCRGTIRNTRFLNTGNDGMDFSGSNIRVYDCFVENAGDKGLSVGEEADVLVFSLDINGAVTGVASKDMSKLTIKDIRMKNCKTGFAAYQKKAEFGPASITVDQYEVENIKHLHLIEKGSTLKLGEKKAEGI